MEIASDKPTIRLRIPILIALLVTGLFMGPFGILKQFDNDNLWTFLPVIVFIIALEAVYTTLWQAHPNRRGTDKWVIRVGEIVFLAVVIRFLAWMTFGGVPDEARLYEYLTSPESFFDATFLIFLIFGLFAWAFAVFWSLRFIGLALQGDELAFYQLPLQERRAMDRQGLRPIVTGRPDLYQSFVKSWFVGGILLIIMIGLASLDLPKLGGASLKDIGRTGVSPLSIIGLLLYFFVGIWLISHAHYQIMKVRWTISGTDIDDNINKRWHRVTALVLISIGAVAAFMPIGETFALQRLAELIVLVALFITNLIFFLLTALLTLPFLLLRRSAPESLTTPTPLEFGTTQPAPVTQAANQELMGAFFWGILLVAVISILLFYLRERGYPLNGETIRALRHAVMEMLRSAWAWLRDRREALAAMLPAVRIVRNSAEDPSRTLPWRFVRVNRLPPREQIRFFYLAAVRRAQEQGVVRQPSETPLEYNADLIDTWPEVETDVEALTEAFLHARYSPRPIEKDEAGLIRQTWRRIRNTLRSRNP